MLMTLILCLIIPQVLSCSSTQYQNILGQCVNCTPAYGQCTSCGNQLIGCYVCSQGSYKNNLSRCNLCSIANCIACSSATQCTLCVANTYYLSGSVCISCATLTSCLYCQDATTCTQCLAGAVVSGGHCVACNSIPNCVACITYPLCTQCVSGFVVDSGNCVACSSITNCIACTTIPFCTNCAAPYIVMPDGSCGLCNSTMPNCVTCTVSTQCIKCDPLYGLTPSHLCSPCNSIPNCYNCTSQSVCNQCISLYGLTATNGCDPCSNVIKCVNCTSISQCLKCIPLYGVSASNTCLPCNTIPNCVDCTLTSACTQCVSLYGISPSGGCDPCSNIPNCINCAVSTACTQCSTGYGISGSSLCQPCNTLIATCLECTYLNFCTLCTALYGVSSTHSCDMCSSIANCYNCSTIPICQECLTLFVLSPTGTCISCSTMSHCYNCTNLISCLECSPFFGLSSTFTCQSCGTMPNCLNCTNLTICTQCDSSSVLTSLYACDLCSNHNPNCQNCIVFTDCLQCKIYYGLKPDKTCDLCSTITNCSECITLPICLVCIAFNGMTTNNDCQTCSVIPNCYNCSTIYACLQCDLLYGLTLTQTCDPCSNILNCYDCLNATNCSLCIIGYGFSSTLQCQICSTINTNCLECTNLTECKVCAPLYGVSVLKACSLCNTISHCVNCTQIPLCLECEVHYALSATKACLPCSTIGNCYDCTDLTHCIECIALFGLSTPLTCVSCSLALNYCSNCTNTTMCTLCQQYYGLNASSLCVPCTTMNGCVDCANISICFLCVPTHFLSAGICVLCPMANCATCQNFTYCINCYIDFYNSGGICYPCTLLSDCLHCLTAAICTGCRPLFGITYMDTCIACTFVPHCSNCLNSTFCFQCLVGYFSNNYGICQQCIWPCSNCSSFSECFACYDNSSLYELNPNTKKCVCGRKFTVDGLCTDIDGCRKSLFANGTETCVFCDVSNKFILVDGICSCNTGFYSNQSKCIPICGDGKKYTEECDDGNNIDGDGCSAFCFIEANYSCVNGTPNHASNCVYNGRIPIAKITAISREGSENIGIFSLSFSPNLLFLSKMNFIEYLQFDCNASFLISKCEFVNNILNVYVIFLTDLENLSANLTINYNQNLIKNNDNQKISFPIISTYRNLFFISNIEEVSQFKMLMSIIVYIFLFIFIFGSVVKEMIGVETLNLCQLVFFSLVLFEQNSPMISALQSLQYSVGYINDNFKTSLSAFNLNKNIIMLNINLFFVENYFCIGVIQITFSFIILALYVFKKFFSSQIKKSEECEEEETMKQYSISEKLIVFIYNKIIFPVTIGFLSMNVLSESLNVETFSSSATNEMIKTIFLFTKTNNISFFICNCISTIVIFIEIRSTLTQNKKQNNVPYKSNYIVVYILYQLALSILICKQTLFPSTSKNSLYAFFVIVVLYTLTIIVYRPYNNKFDNIIIIFNQIGITIYFVGIIFRSTFNENLQTLDKYFILSTFAWLSFVCLFATVRIFLTLIDLLCEEKNILIKKSLKNKERLMSHLKMEQYNSIVEKEILMSGRIEYGAQILNQRLEKIHLFNQERREINLIPMKIKLTEQEENFLKKFEKKEILEEEIKND